MIVKYFPPLSLAWNRMTAALFHPFDMKKWFVVGFTAFLAGLLDGGNGSSGSNNFSKNDEFSQDTLSDILDAPIRFWDWLQDNPLYTALIVVGIILGLLIFVLLTWVSSRGKFMFLDNVVKDQALISKPWNDFAHLGDSLFLFRIVLNFLILALIGILVVFGYLSFMHAYQSMDYSKIPIFHLIKIGLVFFILILVISYISMLLDHFVIPVMYKHNLTIIKAWNQFLTIHWQNLPNFIIYGVIVMLLSIGFVVLFLVLGVMTCCCGIVFLLIPYISTVITLPYPYTIRAYSLEFLAQFGQDFDLFQRSEILTDNAEI